MRAWLCIVSLGLLAGCGWLKPYQLDVPQGNVVTQDQAEKLKPGMSRAQVRFLLGTPLVADPFRPNRWDYRYRLIKNGQLQPEKHFIVHFEGDVVSRTEGEVLPGPKPVLAEPVADTPAANPAAASPSGASS
jgi:outer membrane protein assembly factor BamE